MPLAGQTLYRTLSLDIYGRGNIYLTSDMEKPVRFVDFPKGTGCKLCKLCSPMSKKKRKKRERKN